MPAKFSVSEICERALRKIGAFSINDTAADGEELQEAAFWIDLNVAHMVATQRCTWLIEDTFTTPELTADQVSYVLSTLLGTDYPDDEVLFLIGAYRTDGTNDYELGIIPRREYEAIIKKTTSGPPEQVYLDRLTSKSEQTIYLYPVPADTKYKLKLVFQVNPPDLASKPGQTQHGFHLAWQKWLVLATAAEIADGPVRRLPSAEVDRIRRDAHETFGELQASFNVELFKPQRVKAWGV